MPRSLGLNIGFPFYRASLLISDIVVRCTMTDEISKSEVPIASASLRGSMGLAGFSVHVRLSLFPPLSFSRTFNPSMRLSKKL